jgi:hypothetical protein
MDSAGIEKIGSRPYCNCSMSQVWGKPDILPGQLAKNGKKFGS